MPTVRILLQPLQTLDQPDSQWIEMNLTDQLGEIAVTLTDDRLVTVLK